MVGAVLCCAVWQGSIVEMEDNGLDLTTKNVGICQGRSVKLYAEFMASAEWGNRLGVSPSRGGL